MSEKRRAKILIVTFAVPYPANDGGKIYIFGSIDYLRFYVDITLILEVSTEVDLSNVNKLREIWSNVTIHVVNYYKPLPKNETVVEPKLSIFKLVLYRFLKYKRLLFPQRAMVETPIISNKDFDKPEIYDIDKASNFVFLEEKFVDEVSKLLSENTFDLIQVEYTKYLSLINILPKEAVKIFVEIEGRYLILDDYANTTSDVRPYSVYLRSNSKNLELFYISRYDSVFALSEDDVQRLASHFPSKSIYLSPYCVLDDHLRNSNDYLSFSPLKLIFIGSENHGPNRDAVEWLISSILPLVRRKTRLPLYVTGNWSNEFKQRFMECDNLVFTGFLPDLSPTMCNSISIVPIRIGGGGIRAKVIQAMAFGIPVISTKLGCEGVGVQDGHSVLIANTEIDFAEAIDKLVNNKNLALELIENANRIILRKYSSAATGEKRMDIYKKLLGKKPE